ncbi:hypothetical protein IKQ21_06750 [bacterium]|nr:hypothetical protein [bacterium]
MSQNVAAQLGNLLSVNADINYYTQQSIFWNQKYEANQEKLEVQTKLEQKWEDAYDDAYSATKDIKMNGNVFIHEGEKHNMEKAKAYADWKVEKYDAELMEELSELDVEYDTMKTMYDTLLEELRAQKDADKQAVSTAAQDTGLLQGG